MNQSVSERVAIPEIALLLGYAGLIPFVVLSMGLWVFPESIQDMLHAPLLSYAAIILSFMGAVHWGLAMSSHDQLDQGQMALSIIPPLLAWFASLFPPMINYSFLILGFAGLCLIDVRFTRLGRLRAWYPRLRIPLTLVVTVSLIFAQLNLL